MESTPLLYRTLVQVLGCHQHWLDLRHLKTLAWMVSGLILSSQISLGSWALYIHSRALYLASSIRRFRRFLDNDRIDVHRLYAPCCIKPSKAGRRRNSMWRWTRRCCGIDTVSCGCR